MYYLIIFFYAGEEFRIMIDKYLRQGLHKGVPPLFVDLRSLYKSNEKVVIIENLLLSYVESLMANRRFSLSGNNYYLLLLFI